LVYCILTFDMSAVQSLLESRVSLTVVSALMLGLAVTLRAPAPGTSAPLSPDGEAEAFRKHCRDLLVSFRTAKTRIPVETIEAIGSLLNDRGQSDEQVARKIEQLLEPYCLVVVTINPESRVKAARGSASAELYLKRPTSVLIKVVNEAGVTHALQVTGPEILHSSSAEEKRWLAVESRVAPLLRRALGGHRLEYRILDLTAHESGKREATLKFDVGQGTQDLGFRAEVPVLFVIKHQ
jgi:hypothetical protein